MTDPTCESDNGVQYPFGGCLHHEEILLKEAVCRWFKAHQSDTDFTLFFDFDKELIKEITDVEGCKAIRIFPIIDKNGKMNVMIVPKNVDHIEIPKGTSTELNQIACCGQNGESRFFEEKVKDTCK